MADISKIKLPNNTTYDIKDVSARSAAATAQSTADGKISSSLKGVANGVAELDANGLVPTSQLPSYVDDVLEYATKSVFPTMGESGKIYVDISTNLTYRWSGTAYVEISPSLALGETSSTAYRGDRGKTAYAHATDSNRLTTATAVGLYKVGVTTQGHVSGLTAVAKADITALGIPAQDTTYSSGTGITISGTTINHSNSVTAGTAKGDDTKTLSFGGTFTIPTVTYDAQGHITAKGTTTMTMPSNPNTDRYVNSAAFANDTSGVKMTLTRAGSDTATVTGTIPLVSSSTAGVAPKGATVSSQSQSTKFLREDGSWATPSYTTNTNTTYTISTSGNNITLTPSSGSTQSITAPYATSAGSATKATQDGSGNTITSTYVKKSGDTMTGTLTLYKEGTTAQNYPTELKFQNKDTTTSKTSTGYIRAYDGGESGANFVICPQGNMFIGSGEAAQNHYNLYTHNTSENFYATADGNMYLQANGQTIANRLGVVIDTSHNILPTKADVATNNVGSIGTSSYKWANGYFTNINGVAVGNSPKFTDTNTWRPVQNNLTSDSTTDSLSAAQGKALANGSARDSTKLPLAGGTMTGSITCTTSGANFKYGNITIYGGGTNGGINSMLIGDDVTIGDCNKGGCFGMKSAGSNAGFRFYNSSGTSIGGLQSTNGTLQWFNSSETAYNVSYLTATPTSGQVVITDGTTGGIKSSGYTIAKSVPSNAVFTDTNTTYSFGSSTSTVSIGISTTDPAAFSVDLTLTKDNVTTALGYTPPTANTDVNVKVNNTNPASGTWYYPVWYTATSGTGNVNANDGLRHYSLQGTASAAGRTIMSVGNSTATGTAGNKYGEIWIYAEKAGYAALKYTASATGNSTHTFPTTGGTILNTGTTSFTQSLSSGTKIGTIKINGTSTDLYCQTNTNTHRPIQVNGTEILGNNTTALNLKAGSNVSITNSSGTVTIAATDAKVTQTNTTDNGLYRVLFSESINDTTETEGARKSTKLRFNPSTGQLTLTSLYASGGITAGDGLELGMGSDSTVPFIDFHWNSTDTDYTARLIQRVENTIDFMGKNSGTWGTARAASFSSQSSIYVKENIYSITDDEAKKLLQLRPVIFDYKGDGLKNQRGLIAEEVMDVMPEMVIIPQGYKEYDPIEPWNTPCIDYSKFVPYLIKMVQIQQREIDQLKEQIK